MPTRNRSFNRTCSGGKRRISTTWANLPAVQFEWKTMFDTYGKKRNIDGYLPNSYYKLQVFKLRYEPVYYKNPTPGLALNDVVGMCPTTAPVSLSHLSFSGLPTNDQWALTLLERTNPFRSVYSIPTNIAELIDCVKLLYKFGNLVVAGMAQAQVRYNFGIRTLKQDIKDLDKILTHIHKRILEFRRLWMKGGLHRRIPLWKGSLQSAPQSGVSIAQLSTMFRYGDVTTQTKLEIFGSVRWFPTLKLLPAPDAITEFQRAARVCLDIEPSSIGWDTQWNAIPFSWLVDYFTDVGTILSATKGRQLVEPRYITISSKYTTVRRAVDTSGTVGSSGGSYRATQVTVERFIYPDNYGGFQITVNSILSSDQLTNLMALLISLQKRI